MQWTSILWALATTWIVLSSSIVAWAQTEEVTELGTKVVQGVEITVVVRPPLSREQMADMMRDMGMGKQGRQGMSKQGMQGMGKQGRQGMQGMGMPKPTHYLGVIIKDAKTGTIVQGLTVSVQAGGVANTQPVRLWAMRGSYAKGIALPQKGQYTLRITAEGLALKAPIEASFDFAYR